MQYCVRFLCIMYRSARSMAPPTRQRRLQRCAVWRRSALGDALRRPARAWAYRTCLIDFAPLIDSVTVKIASSVREGGGAYRRSYTISHSALFVYSARRSLHSPSRLSAAVQGRACAAFAPAREPPHRPQPPRELLELCSSPVEPRVCSPAESFRTPCQVGTVLRGELRAVVDAWELRDQLWPLTVRVDDLLNCLFPLCWYRLLVYLHTCQ